MNQRDKALMVFSMVMLGAGLLAESCAVKPGELKKNYVEVKGNVEKQITALKSAPIESKFDDTPVRHPIKISQNEFECLARNIFYEAGVEPWEGKIAVAQVTYNRLGMRKSWDNICKVVYAKAQFSWTLDKNKKYGKPSGPLWRESLQAAKDFVDGIRLPELEGSDHYYQPYLINKPTWAHSMERVVQIGRHAFYVQKD